jgi:hypothetical protein
MSNFFERTYWHKGVCVLAVNFELYYYYFFILFSIRWWQSGESFERGGWQQ